ncbi:2-methylaconitate cis-trans isomerase PrpF family protein [Mongoliimonas terrestris]|uniref:2-methylaconitate cis-trans isomerase PrpF family protein n=1 Tax=Mongoliimonas terrestris TaxID=1709001 RepID=UPI00094994AD|nr:PrpF domain-containing protein [Mongoliimonas terrestris]
MLISRPDSAIITPDAEQISVPCLFMRGGSSRGGFFLDTDLPPDPVERAAFLLAAYGSPDHRQIDGIGGADPLTSKAAVVGRSTRPDADVDYTFYQVGIDRPQVSTGGNCGNMLAAVAPFAVLRGLVPAVEPETTVRIHTTNTGQVVVARMTVRNGRPSVDGDAAVPGVPGTGSPIQIDFGDCAGAVSGRLLPTGAATDRVQIGSRTIPVSLIDAATPFVFVHASDVGARGTESPAEILADTRLMDDLEAVRGWAAVALGLVDKPERARTVTPNVPRVMMIAAPADYAGSEGPIAAADIDLCVRQLAMQKPHHTLAVTGAVCTAVAISVPGSIANRLAGRTSSRVRLGQPAGVLTVSAQIDIELGGPVIRSASVERTARLIMSGGVHVSTARLEAHRGLLIEEVEAARDVTA